MAMQFLELSIRTEETGEEDEEAVVPGSAVLLEVSDKHQAGRQSITYFFSSSSQPAVFAFSVQFLYMSSRGRCFEQSDRIFFPPLTAFLPC